VKVIDFEGDVMNTRSWNILAFAIYFRQLDILKMLIEYYKVPIKMGLSGSRHSDEFKIDDVIDTSLDGNFHLFGIYLAIEARDLKILRYIYEVIQHALQLDWNDCL
jgi:hypothetical protein